MREMLVKLQNLIARAKVDRPGEKPQLAWLGDRIAPEVENLLPQGFMSTAPAGAQGALLAPSGDTSVALAVGLQGDTPEAPDPGECGLHYLGEWKVFVAADGSVHLGEKDPSDFVALASLVDARFAQLQTAFDAHTHVVSTAPGTSAIPVPVIGSFAPVGSTAVKAS